MYTAQEAYAAANAAKEKETVAKRCIAQHFFAAVYPLIEERVGEGCYNMVIKIPRKYGAAVKEIFEIFDGLGYSRQTVRKGWFNMKVRICWQVGAV